MPAIAWKFVRVRAEEHAQLTRVAEAKGLPIGKAFSEAVRTYVNENPATVGAAPGDGESK